MVLQWLGGAEGIFLSRKQWRWIMIPPQLCARGMVCLPFELFLLFFNFIRAQRGMWRLLLRASTPEPFIPREQLLGTSRGVAQKLCWLAAWIKPEWINNIPGMRGANS